jgi:hypothetical protein
VLPGTDLLSGPRLSIVDAMPSRAVVLPFPRTAASVLLVLAACSGKAAADPNQREVSWAYGPTKGGATAEHVQGIGGKNGPAISKGWQCRLQDGKRLLVRPYQLAAEHPLFGKVALVIGLYDKTGKELAMLTSAPLTAANASFTFELDAAVAGPLWDLVLWYRKA